MWFTRCAQQQRKRDKNLIGSFCVSSHKNDFQWNSSIHNFGNWRRGGGSHQNRTWMWLPDLENLTFSIPIFCPISHPLVYHFWKKSPQLWPNWVLLQKFAQNTLNLCNFGSFVSDENPIAIPNFVKKRPKRHSHIRIPCQWETPRLAHSCRRGCKWDENEVWRLSLDKRVVFNWCEHYHGRPSPPKGVKCWKGSKITNKVSNVEWKGSQMLKRASNNE